ncbi:MAG: oligoendopeptidase F [Melioribacteraceae bacterium]|nr:oligoendopeptidase F [Melioribacteraceae bacterium]
MTRLFSFLITVFIMLGFILVGDGPYKNLPPFQPDANIERSKIPDIYKWNLKDLFPSIEKWNSEIELSKAGLEDLRKLQSDLSTPQGLAKYLKAYFDLDNKINALTLYANMERDVESSSQETISRHELALNLTEEIMREGAVLRQAVMNLSQEELKEAMKQEKALEEYLPYFKSLLRRADRMLSPNEEKILSLAGDNLWAQIDLNELPSASEKAFRAIISDFKLPMIKDQNGKEVQLSFSNYGIYRGSQDRATRARTVEAMFGSLKEYENTFATTLGEQARFSLFLSRARGYETVLEAYLDKDNLTPDVYMNLINTVRANVKPLHKYIDLRKKALGLDEVHLYDLYVPMVEQSSIEMDYNTGAEYILEAIKPMGNTYVDQVKFGMDPSNGWIDVYPSNDKNSGAFSTATYGVHPYVKMNFQNSFDDVSTLAHEYGHAIHSYFAMSTQPYLSWRYPPFLAEIASTCNEAFLSRYMIENAKSDKEKAWLLSELLETIRTTIYRQTLFAEFELRLHQIAEAGQPISAAKLNEIYGELKKTYYGPNYTLDKNDNVEWAYIPHFYYKYYVFAYATGLSAGIAFAEKISEEGAPAQEAYINMLKGGSSKPPLDLLKEAGVDMTKPNAIQAALNLFDKTVDELDQLLSK